MADWLKFPLHFDHLKTVDTRSAALLHMSHCYAGCHLPPTQINSFKRGIQWLVPCNMKSSQLQMELWKR